MMDLRIQPLAHSQVKRLAGLPMQMEAGQDWTCKLRQLRKCSWWEGGLESSGLPEFIFL